MPFDLAVPFIGGRRSSLLSLGFSKTQFREQVPLKAGPNAGCLLLSEASPLKPEWATEKKKSTMKRYSLRPNTAILRRSNGVRKRILRSQLMRKAGPVLSLPPLEPPAHTWKVKGGKTVGGPKAVAVLALTQKAAYQRDMDCGVVELLGAWKLGRLNAE